jgi:F-type H+-transporting ATPase subunit b
MELLQLLDIRQVIAQIISFLILLFLLRRFLWSKMLAVIDARKARIEKHLQEIEAVKKSVLDLRSDYQTRISGIETQAKMLTEQAVAEGFKAAQGIKKDAHLQAQQIIETAKDNIKYEIEKAKEVVKEQIIDLSIRAAEEVIQEKLTEEQDRRIVKDFLNKVGQVKP